VLRLLSRDPAARFASADDVVSALASVNLLAVQAAPGQPARGRASAVPTRRIRVFSLRAVAFVALPLMVLTGFAAWLARNPAPPDQPVIIAVLPFTERADDDDAYLGIGIADALVTYLAALPAAAVTGGQIVTGEAADALVADVARRRGADVVVSGVVERSTDSVRVSVTLFEAARQHSTVRVHAAVQGSLPVLQASIARNGSRAAARWPTHRSHPVHTTADDQRGGWEHVPARASRASAGARTGGSASAGAVILRSGARGGPRLQRRRGPALSVVRRT
jgi:TolB-like protein